MKKKSKFVVLEGVDAVGKTSLAREVQKLLGTHKVAMVSEFPDSYLDGYLARLVQTSPDLQLNKNISTPLAQTAVLAGAALYKYESEVKQLMQMQNSPDLILMDRYIYSIMAYQEVAVRSESEEVIRKTGNLLNHLLEIVPEPDMVVYLTIPTDVMVARIEGRGEPTPPEYIEFLEEVKHSYENALEQSGVKYYEFIANNGLKNDALNLLNIIYSSDDGAVCLINQYT